MAPNRWHSLTGGSPGTLRSDGHPTVSQDKMDNAMSPWLGEYNLDFLERGRGTPSPERIPYNAIPSPAVFPPFFWSY